MNGGWAKRSFSLRRAIRWSLAIVAAGTCAAGGYYVYILAVGNFHTVVDGQVYRSAQPSPDELADWAERYKLKTVINLRGKGSSQTYRRQRAAAAGELGLDMIDVRFSAVRLPSALALRRLIEALESARRPMLIHCKAGADRTGVASVLAAMAIGQQPYTQARGQLSARYLHFDDDENHIAGLFAEYERWRQARSLEYGGWTQFRQWALNEYHTEYFFVRIVAPRKLQARPAQAISVSVEIHNASGRTLPAGDPARTFHLAVFSGSSENDSPDREYGRRTPLGKRDIPPDGSVVLSHRIVAPAETGVHIIHFDVVEERRTWFGRQGSPTPTCELTVSDAAGPDSSGLVKRQVLNHGR